MTRLNRMSGAVLGVLHRRGVLRTVGESSSNFSDQGSVVIEFGLIPHRWRPSVGAWLIRRGRPSLFGDVHRDSVRVREHIRTGTYHRIRFDVRWAR